MVILTLARHPLLRNPNTQPSNLTLTLNPQPTTVALTSAGLCPRACETQWSLASHPMLRNPNPNPNLTLNPNPNPNRKPNQNPNPQPSTVTLTSVGLCPRACETQWSLGPHPILRNPNPNLNLNPDANLNSSPNPNTQPSAVTLNPNTNTKPSTLTVALALTSAGLGPRASE